MTPEEKIREIENRLAEATPGPWSHDEHDCIFGDGTVVADYPRRGNGRADQNAELIANAPKDISWLLGELLVLRTALTGVLASNGNHHTLAKALLTKLVDGAPVVEVMVAALNGLFTITESYTSSVEDAISRSARLEQEDCIQLLERRAKSLRDEQSYYTLRGLVINRNSYDGRLQEIEAIKKLIKERGT